MAKASRPPSTRKTDVTHDAVVDRAFVAKRDDPRQAGLFDEPLPERIKPCLPTLVDKPPVGPQWVHEIKWDGYRVSAYVANGKVTIRTRNGHDWTARFPTISANPASLSCKPISTSTGPNAPCFTPSICSSSTLSRCAASRWGERRLALGGIIPKRSAILLSEDYQGSGADLFRIACENDLEGIVSKRLDRAYRFGRSRDWLKTKCVGEDSFVIIGYQPGSGSVRTPLSNIKVARFDGERLTYAAAVGTGFSETIAAALRERLDRIRTPRCPIAGLRVSGAVWVSPDLQARIGSGAAQRRVRSLGGLSGRDLRKAALAEAVQARPTFSTETPNGLSTPDLGIVCLKARGFDHDDPVLIRAMVGVLSNTLKKAVRRGEARWVDADQRDDV